MNIRERIEAAQHGHAQVVDLRRALVAELAAQIERENAASDDAGQDVHNLGSLIESMSKRAADDPAYRTCLKASYAAIFKDLNRLQLLASALQS